MHLVKSCPSCGTKLRFPLDRGVIQVRCSCGYSFKADPDDRALYLDGRIDLEDNRTGPAISPGELLARARTRLSSMTLPRVDLKKTTDKLIRDLYGVRYWIQNYPLHTNAEKRRVLIPVIAVILIAAMFIFALMIVL